MKKTDNLLRRKRDVFPMEYDPKYEGKNLQNDPVSVTIQSAFVKALSLGIHCDLSVAADRDEESFFTEFATENALHLFHSTEDGGLKAAKADKSSGVLIKRLASFPMTDPIFTADSIDIDGYDIYLFLLIQRWIRDEAKIVSQIIDKPPESYFSDPALSKEQATEKLGLLQSYFEKYCSTKKLHGWYDREEDILLLNEADILSVFDTGEILQGKFPGLSELMPGITVLSPVPSRMKQEEAKRLLLSYGRELPDAMYTEEQKTRIPVISDRLVVTSDMLLLNEYLSEIKDDPNATAIQRNILLEGAAGSGKSTTAVTTAAIQKMPFGVFSAKPSDDSISVIGSIVPDLTQFQETAESSAIGFRAVDILMNPEKVFEHFGLNVPENADDLSAFDCLIQQFNRQELFAPDGTRPEYRFFVSNLIKGLVSGEVVELQELKVISDSGVMVELNAFLEGGYIHTPAGDFQRHPDSILIATTNTADYLGVHELNESVRDRFGFVIASNPGKEEIIARAMARNEVPGKYAKYIHEMYEAMLSVKAFIEDYSVPAEAGPRALNDWVAYFMRKLRKLPDEPTEDNIYILLAQTSKNTLLARVSTNAEHLSLMENAIMAATPIRYGTTVA